MYGGHVFENNDLHDTVRETFDHGPFNSYGRDRYWCQHVNHPGYVPQGQNPHHGPTQSQLWPLEVIAEVGQGNVHHLSKPLRGQLGLAIILGRASNPGLTWTTARRTMTCTRTSASDVGEDLLLADCKIHDNVFLQVGDLPSLQPFDGRLEVKDNRFLRDLTPEEAEGKFFAGVRFGLTHAFPAWLKDRSE